MAATSQNPVSTDGGDCNGFVSAVDIGPNDVLFGRGRIINDNPGNVAFRSLAASRKTEYLGAKGYKEKNRIAKEIVDHIRYHVNPPGRFLTTADMSVAEAMGFSDDVEVWCPVDDKTVLEKSKQTLRQIKKWGGAEQRKRPAEKRVEPLAGEESRGSGDHFKVHDVDDIRSSAQIGISSTNIDEASIDELIERMPPIEKSEALAIGEQDAYLGTNHAISLENSVTATASLLGVVPTTDERTLFPAQLDQMHQIQAQDMAHGAMASVKQMSVERGKAPFGAMEQAGSNIEIGEDERALDKRSSLFESVRLASELVKTVRKGHDAGLVAYGSDVNGDPFNLSGECIRRDLVSLGFDLYRHFAGAHPFDPNTGSTASHLTEDAGAALEGPSIFGGTQAKKKERRPCPRQYVLLRDLGLPVSLCILVSCCLDAEDEGDADRYETADEVEEDLNLMIADPYRYLFDAGADRLRGHLVFPEDRLYGREHHISSMMKVFDRVTVTTSGPREMLLICGYSGTGKSALVEQLRGPLLRRNGYFISGKFDQLGQAQPMSVIFDAFNEYCNGIAEGNDDSRAQIRREIQRALGSHGNVLTDLIPNLVKVVGEVTTDAVHVGGREALNRFFFYFGLFVQAISSPSHPVILFLDDLQWADKASLELISTIVSDCKTTSFLFIGSYRDNEVGIEHPLTIEAGKLALSGDVSISNIKLENIDRKSVNALVADVLHLSPRLTWSLGDIVYNKTSGNPLFAVQFLRSLCDDKLLQYSARSRRWEWNIENIQSKDLADNVVDLMTEKILKLDSKVRRFLKMAACLGSRCEPSTLKLLVCDDTSTSDEWDIVFLLDIAVREGLMCKLGSVYKFSHDQIQQAAYSLIDVSEREALHLHIGRYLWKRTSKEELEKLIFIVVDQLQRGSSLISDHDEKVEVARLCLAAGEKAMSSSAFLQASIYLLQGSALLQESDWQDHYDLSLRLFSCCAEAQYTIGNYDALKITVNPVLLHGRSLQDKLSAHYSVLRSLGCQGKILDAVIYGLDVLGELGESFPLPKETDRDVVMTAYEQLQAKLSGTMVDEALLKATMQERSKVAVMRLLNILSKYAYQVDQELMALMVFRMVDLSLSFGACHETSLAVANFGVSLCHFFGEFKQGHKYGKLALALLSRFPADEHLPSIHTWACGGVLFFTEPHQACLPSLKRGHEVGMSLGDIDPAANCANMYLLSALQCGIKLDELIADGRVFTQQMDDYKLHNNLSFSLMYLQAALNLAGSSEDPTVLTGEATNQDELLNRIMETRSLNATRVFYFFRLWLAYLFGKYGVAAEMVELCRSMDNSFRGTTVVNETFYSGLTAVAIARGGEKSGEWKSIAADAAEKLKTWVGNCSSWNFQHKLDLLNAEISYLNGDLDEAAEKYDDAIRVAGEHGFVHEQALACERAGIFYSEVFGADMATDYFERSHGHYLQWGAKRKADDIRRRIEEA